MMVNEYIASPTTLGVVDIKAQFIKMYYAFDKNVSNEMDHSRYMGLFNTFAVESSHLSKLWPLC